jgi:DNA-binding MarR family transcriptional regulator
MTAIPQKAPMRFELSGVLIEHTAKRMKHVFAKILSDHFENKITVDQWVVLYQLYKVSPLSQYEIASHVYKDAPTVTRIIDILLVKQYIEKIIDVDDRRKFLISISEQGKSLVREILPHLNSFREKCYQNISETELINLEKILNKINQNLY